MKSPLQEARDAYLQKHHNAPWAVFMVCGDNPASIRDAFNRSLMTPADLQEAFTGGLIAGDDVRRLVHDILRTEVPRQAVAILRKELIEVKTNLLLMDSGRDIDPVLMAEAIEATLKKVEGI